MKLRMLLAVALVALGTGCKDPRVDELQTRVTKLETDYATLKTEHDKTRAKLQELLHWVDRLPPPKVGLMDWIDAAAPKIWPGTSDPTKPSSPPDPF